MRSTAIVVCSFVILSAAVLLVGQAPPPAAPAFPPQTISLPTFTSTATVAGTNYTYTLLGGDPTKGGTTTIPTVLVAITLTIDAPIDAEGRKAVLDAAPIARQVIRSPIFADYPFASGKTQYGDALMRADFYAQGGSGEWHTRLGQPKVVPLKIEVPIGRGYVLTSKKSGRMLAMVDLRFMQQEIFNQLPKDAVPTGTLLVAVVRNTTYYVNSDATQCCHWGTYGVDTSAGARQPFVLGTYLDPSVVDVDADVQPITQQIARFFRDPLHDPLYRGPRGAPVPGNSFPAWMKVPPKTDTELPRQNSASGGSGIASLGNDPTDVNWKNTVQASKPFIATMSGTSYHLQNVALLQWYNQSAAPTSLQRANSFPDVSALAEPARPAPAGRRGGGAFGAATPAASDTVKPVALTGGPNGHKLIGYWSGYGPIRDVSPQWDVILVAFATPDHAAGEGQMQYRVNGSMTSEEFKADIKLKQAQGKKVMISLGGGGQVFALETEADTRRFVTSVEAICTEFGFDGIDIDFETPSLEVQPGDTDPKHPTTRSTVNLIAAMREIHDHFGPQFMVSLVPEGSQTPAGYPGYGGQFGSYLPLIEAIRDILSFVDTQDYNCPPIQGLDGEYYMPGSVDYHAAATELFLQGFDVGRNRRHHFDPLPPDKVIIGYLNSDTTPQIVAESMRMLVTGRSDLPTKYKLLQPGGYPTFSGAMFWTIDADRREEYRYSNSVGPLLHGFGTEKR
jgi:chitinase